MNVVTRGIKNALRSPLRSGAIIVMLAISIGLILSMLVARSSVIAKIDDVKATAGTSITITPAGVMGFMGGGDPLTSEQVSTIKSTAHIVASSATLTDQLGTDDTNLTSSLTLGSFGARQQRFESSASTPPAGAESFAGGDDSSRPTPTPRTQVTGTTDANSVSTNGGDLTITSGVTIDGNSSDLTALVGTDLATKNELAVGDTFTAYGKTVSVVGIYDTGNAFQDSGLIMPLATLQGLTEQAGAVTSVIVTIDSSDNVDSVVSTLKSTLGDKADVTSQAAQAASSVSSLESIASLATAGVVGATIAGAVIVLLAMVMVVRERRREIGVIKAIGGPSRSVIGQFVTEALTLTVIGAAVGLSLGILVSGPMTQSLVTSSNNSTSSQQEAGPGGFVRGGFAQIGTNVNEVTASLTPQIFATAAGITLIIAIVGSAVPAWLIARVRPAEVLRSE